MKGIGLRTTVASCVIGLGCAVGIPALAHAQHDKDQSDQDSQNDRNTRTPIKHVIYIIGENRSFDHGFATFVPRPGQTIDNLLSEGIIRADGSKGPNWSKAQQWEAVDSGTFSVHPRKTVPFGTLPPVNTDGAPKTPDFPTAAAARDTEPALPYKDYFELASGGTGLNADVVDTRFPGSLADGPFLISRYTSYNSYTSSPVHRFFQMWQETDCDITKATKQNPSGCQEDLWPWVETTEGAGTNGKPLPAGFTDETTGEGSTSMGMWNVQAGDAPYFTKLAKEYALEDNYHQAIEGGTGANHIFVGYGTAIFYADANGNPTTPPSNQIENPNAQTGTNNWWVQDGYSGGSYVDCSDTTQPGIAPVTDYEKSLPYKVLKACQKGAYYLVNNYNPGYLGTGVAAPLGATVYTIPPSSQYNLALLLHDHHISWKYYGEGWAGGTETGEASTFCNICDPFLYSKQVMTTPSLRARNQDIQNLYSDIDDNQVPAVSIVKPDGFLDGHPASSKWDLFEGFVQKIVEKVQRNPKLWSETAIIITEDEGGGYYDSGYIEPVDFFGDGTRIATLIVSPFTKGVGMVHLYGDHVSFDKFVEANWGLPPISKTGRDNLPNPIMRNDNPYVPVNPPAISDLMAAFNFHQDHHHDGGDGYGRGY